VSIPKAEIIHSSAFGHCPALRTITLGDSAPTVGSSMFSEVPGNPTITVKIPTGATGYDKPGTVFPQTYSQSANHTVNWANGFRGLGWDATKFINTSLATPVILRIEER
jgi:hypothetical protein